MRTLPNDIKAEKTLLSTLLANPKGKAKIQDIIQPDDFYSEKHPLVFKALLELDKPDILQLKAIMEKQGTFQKVGMDFLYEVAGASLTSTGGTFYANRIKEMARRRTLALSAESLFQDSCNPAMDILDTLSKMKTMIRTLEHEHQVAHEGTRDLLNRVFKEIESRNQSGTHSVGILSGYNAIDRHLNGFEPKSLTYIAARPSVGKTALAVNIAESFSQQDAGAVPFFSLEMGAEAITRRRLSAESGVYLSRIRSGDIDGYQWPKLITATDRLSKRPFEIFDSPKFKSIEDLTSRAESFAMDKKVCAVFVDHIQLMHSRKKFGNRHLELSFISNGLKSMAKNLNIPVIALTQLNRNIENRTNQRPVLSDLKESGDLEQDADHVIAIYRESKESRVMELGGLKGRDCGTWQGELDFDRFTQEITEMPS